MDYNFWARNYKEYSLPRTSYLELENNYADYRGGISLTRQYYDYTLPRFFTKQIKVSDKLDTNDVIDHISSRPKQKLGLLLPAHNEELIIQTTIASAVAAGIAREDIYVVDDSSNDTTRAQALSILGPDNVLSVQRSGKAGAVNKAIQHFGFDNRYEWLHVSDADCIFGNDYFNIYRRSLKGGEYVVAVGFVQSLRGNWISNYRSFAYTYSQHIIKRWQSWFGMIAILPGPTTCFRTDILKDLDFVTGTLTEDFDLTLQIHRNKLGKILYVPEAVTYTQDPNTVRDFCKQTLRWQRGFFQGIVNHRIGRRLQAIDFSIGYTLFQMFIYIFEMGVLVPYLIHRTGRWDILGYVLLADFFVVSLLAFFSSAVTKRLSIIYALPYYYFLRWLEVGILIRAFVEVVILRRFPSQSMGWATEGRRFALNAYAMKDIAL